MLFDIKKTIRNFILNEGSIQRPSLQSFLENLSKILEVIKPHSIRETRYLEVARHQLKEIKSGIRRLEEEKQLLEEKVKLLEEEKVKRSRKK